MFTTTKKTSPMNIRATSRKLPFVLLLLSSVVFPTFSQNTFLSREKIVLGIGGNIIDDSFTSTFNPVASAEQWNTSLQPSHFSLGIEVANRTFIEIASGTNNYKKGKLVDGKILLEDGSYAALDLALKYKLINPTTTSYGHPKIDPFVSLGGGQTKINQVKRLTINYGFGFYIWFAKSKNCKCYSNTSDVSRLGLIFQTQGKSSLNQKKYGNQIQHVFGFVYRL